MAKKRSETLADTLTGLRSKLSDHEQRATDLAAKTTAGRTDEENAEFRGLIEGAPALRSEIKEIEELRDSALAEEQRSDAALAARNAGQPGAINAGKPGTIDGQFHVTSEELTYTERKSKIGEANFFTDAYRSQHLGDPMSIDRLRRNATEYEVEARKAGTFSESRATTTASFASLVVPQYLVDLFAPVLRAGRPAANIMENMPLPDQGMVFTVPRGTTGAAVASQATQNTSLQSTDMVNADLTVNVVTIGGQQDVSRQSLERGTPGIDRIIFADLFRAYNAEVDRQVLAGSGASGQMLGIQNTSGIYQATAYTAAATLATFFSKTAGAVASIASAGTEVVPGYWIMHPRRWYWITSQLDSQGRPMVPALAGGNVPMNAISVNVQPGAYSADGDANPPKVVGYLHGLPVITDANVPTSVGTGPEDLVFLVDNTKAILWEDGGGVPRQLRFEQTLGNQLTVKLVVYNYLAFTAGRYPVAFGLVGGNAGTVGFGQVAPSF